MKTAISIPDETFQRAERAAQFLGISRSEFYARAADLLTRHIADQSVTARMDAALERAQDDDEEFAVTVGRRVVQGDGEGW